MPQDDSNKPPPRRIDLAAGSPDRADAMVWAMTELFEKAAAEPRIRRL